jgi:hypothetical protein
MRSAAELAAIVPVEPKKIKLDTSEVDYFDDRAAELNWVLNNAIKNTRFGDARECGEAIGLLANYLFRMGRKYEQELNDIRVDF